MKVTRRSFVETGCRDAEWVIGVPPISLLAAQKAKVGEPTMRWLQCRSRIYWYDRYSLNEQDSAFSRYDPDRIAEELAGTGADIIVIYAANRFSIAYYPSKILPQHPSLNGRDHVGDLVSILRERGKKIVCYINWLESRRPDWYATTRSPQPT
jgi:hypothetical protein